MCPHGKRETLTLWEAARPRARPGWRELAHDRPLPGPRFPGPRRRGPVEAARRAAPSSPFHDRSRRPARPHAGEVVRARPAAPRPKPPGAKVKVSFLASVLGRHLGQQRVLGILRAADAPGQHRTPINQENDGAHLRRHRRRGEHAAHGGRAPPHRQAETRPRTPQPPSSARR